MGPAAGGGGLRVGLVANGWPPDVGGVPGQVELLARGLAERGARPAVLALSTGGEHAPGASWCEEGWPFPVRRLRADYGREMALMDGVKHPAAESELARWIVAEELDLVHVHHLTGFGLGCLSVPRELGVPSVMTLHDYWCFCPRGQMWHVDGRVCARPEQADCAGCLARTWPRLLSATAEGAVAGRLAFVRAQLALPTALVTPSRRAAEILAACGLGERKLEVIPGGSQPQAAAQAGAGGEVVSGGVTRLGKGRRGQGVVRIGLLGATQVSKGTSFLARVIAASPELEVELHIHGPAVSDHGLAHDLEHLEELVAGERRLHLHGAFSPRELNRVLGGLDYLAAPALWEETFGLTVREARAAGLPVLVSDRGALAEGLTPGPHLRVLPAGDGRAWAAALGGLPSLPREPDRAVPGVEGFVDAHQELYGRLRRGG